MGDWLNSSTLEDFASELHEINHTAPSAPESSPAKSGSVRVAPPGDFHCFGIFKKYCDPVIPEKPINPVYFQWFSCDARCTVALKMKHIEKRRMKNRDSIPYRGYTQIQR
jgi:hypothetical protein